jgi:ATP-dependent exoDNAse (exonuclease V) beta subunit
MKKEISTKPFLKHNTVVLLNTVSNELKIQEEQNVLSISEFNDHSPRNSKSACAFIYERERYRLFIDEFQDTSEMQWQNRFR